MRKMLVFTLIGISLAIYLYGVFNNIINFYDSKNVEEIDKGYTIVYME